METQVSIRRHLPEIISLGQKAVQHCLRIIFHASSENDGFPLPDRKIFITALFHCAFQLFLCRGMQLYPPGHQGGVALRRSCHRLEAQALYHSISGPVIQPGMVIDFPVLYDALPALKLLQKLFCKRLCQEVPFPYFILGLSSAVIQHSPHYMAARFLRSRFPGKHSFILFPLFHRYPESRLQIKSLFPSGQVIQPLHRDRKFSCSQVSLHHQQGVELFLILRQFLLFLLPGQLLCGWFHPLHLSQFLICRLTDSGR